MVGLGACCGVPPLPASASSMASSSALSSAAVLLSAVSLTAASLAASALEGRDGVRRCQPLVDLRLVMRLVQLSRTHGGWLAEKAHPPDA